MDYLNDIVLLAKEEDKIDNNSNEIIETVKKINEEMRDPQLQTFSKTTYWNQDSKKQEDISEALLYTLQGIESIILNIEKLLRDIQK
jgi:hypothetical protein